MSEANASAPRVRLQKFLSDAGVASRRRAEELILDGRVLVNDQVVDTLPAFMDPRHDRVVVDGALVRTERHVYFLVHKPKGVVCTDRDPGGRLRAVDLLPPLKARLFIVGRLDADSSGLLLMTNDGELAERITHPRYGVPKVYRAEVRGRVPANLPEQMKAGVYLSDGKARATNVRVTHRGRDASVLQITLKEGRNRQVRRMLARLGHRVTALKRLAIGPLTLKRLPVGAARPLTVREVADLRRAVEQRSAQVKGQPRRRGRSKRRSAGPPNARKRAQAPAARRNAPARRRRVVS
jgi:23S rRNA pseudouridine2605 synthase